MLTEWQNFCRGLESAGNIVAEATIAQNPFDQAEGYRYLSRLLRIALDMQIENADPAFPAFYAASHATAKIGADNPDNIYHNATISAKYRYRISGNRGGVPILSFGTKANRYAIDGTMASSGELDAADMVVAPDGSFEITVSQDEAPGNWLKMDADSSILIVRQTFLDRATQTPATVKIERLGAQGETPAIFDAAALSAGLTRSLGFVEGTAKTFLRWAELFRAEHCNQLNTVEQGMFFKAGGDPTIFYLHGYWQLQPDEALEIHTRIPECTFWNFQVDNIWMESLDYRHHRIHLNGDSAKLNPDGSVTIMVAASDPGHENWLSTAGHSQGTMLLRWTSAATHPIPTTKVIKR